VGSFLKKNCLFVLLLILVGFFVNAQNGHLFSVGFSVGLLSGASEEIVYRSSSANSYMSQLTWPFTPLFYAGIDAGYSWQGPAYSGSVFQAIFSGFFFDANVKFGLPGETMMMEDRDWIRQPTWALSHYSVHDNKIESAMLAGVDLGKSIQLYNEFRLGVFLSYNVMYYEFAARGGTFLYPELDGGHFYDPSPENVVTYRQFWQILSPGLSFYGVFNNYFDIEFFFKATPLIMASSFDEHLSRTLQIINDPMFYGLYLEPGFVFTFRPTASNFMLVLSLNYKNIRGTRGNSRYRYPDNSTTYRNVGGADYSAFDLSIAAKIGFGG